MSLLGGLVKLAYRQKTHRESLLALIYRTAATTPLPQKFSPDEIGLMTLEEFVEFKNPGKKFHAGDTYDFDLKKMNRSQLYAVAEFKDWKLKRSPQGFLLTQDHSPKAILHKGTLYLSGNLREDEVPNRFWEGYNREIDLDWNAVRKVKYVSEYIHLIDDVAKRERENHPHLLRQFKLGDEYFTIRSAKNPKKNAQDNLAIFNSEGQIVAAAQNEWGATLLVVAQEYRGRGLGQIIGETWYKINPSSTSGGFTNAGLENAKKLWAKRVREFLTFGWYSDLVDAGRVSSARVREILSDLGERPQKRQQPKSKKRKPEILVYAEYPTFVVYDEKFLDDPDEEHIYGFGFFRDASVGEFLYTIDYERKYAKLTLSVAMQMARDEGQPVYMGAGYRDFMDLDAIAKDVEMEGDYAQLTRDVLPLRALSNLERTKRKKKSPYGEKEVLLLELAEYKWRHR